MLSWIIIVSTMLFVGLKLMGLIGWEWWIVLSPIWAPVVAGMVFIGCLFIVALLNRS